MSTDCINMGVFCFLFYKNFTKILKKWYLLDAYWGSKIKIDSETDM